MTLLARQGDWYKVSVDGKTGYMMAKYLKVTADMHNGTARVFNANGGSYVNFRSRASLSANVIGTVPVGTTVKVLEKTTDWTKVEGKRQDRLHLHLVPQILIPALLPQKALAQSGRRFFHRIDGFPPQAATNSAFRRRRMRDKRINFPALLKLILIRS